MVTLPSGGLQWLFELQEQRSKEKKHKKEICPNHKMFEKNIGPHLFFQIPYLPHFLSMLNNLKSCGCAKWNSLNSKGNKAMSKEFKLKITNCFNEPIIKH
jgi:hypothetical protein